MKLIKKLSLITALSTAALAIPFVVLSCSNNTQRINVVSTNDMHGRLEKNDKSNEAGIQAINGYLKAQPHDLLLDGGDLIQGTALNDVDKGKTMAEITTMLGYDAIAVGNHEFDFGLDNLLNITKNVNTNFLSANVRYKVDDSAENKKKDERVFSATKIKTLNNGLKVGIIGLTTPETAYKTHPANVAKVEFTDLVTETKQEIDALEQQGINFITVVSHVGQYATVPLAQALENKIDLIIDGHTHQDFQQTVGTTQIIQTGEYTKGLRKSSFDFNPTTGFIENFQSALIGYDELIKYENQADAVVVDKVKTLKAAQATEFAEVVIQNNPHKLNGERNDVRRKETNLGDLVTDAMFWEAQKTISDVDFAITNSGGIRSSIQPGVVTKKNTYDVFPFGNKLVVLKSKGKVLRQAFDRSVISNTGDKETDGALLQVSENVKLMQQPDGQWKYQIKRNGTFSDLDDETVYKFATQDFTQNGGDGYTMFKNLRELFSGTDLKGIIEEYLKKLNASPNEWAKYQTEFSTQRLSWLPKQQS